MTAALLLSLLLGLTNFHSSTFYVAVNGSDSNKGSLESPWRTLTHAVRNSAPGDTILLRGGTYTEEEIWIRDRFGWGGAPGRMKTIANYPGESPILKTGNGIQIYASWVRVKGLHFVDAGVASRTDDGNIVENVEVTGNLFTGNFPYGAVELVGNNLLISDNTIELAGQHSVLDHGIYLHTGSNNVIRGNRILNPKGFGIHIYDERKRTSNARQLSTGFQNVIVESNFVYGSQGASGIVVATKDGIPVRNVWIRNNTFASNSLNGIEIRTGENVQIFNNTVVDNGRQGIHIRSGSHTGNVSIINNIIVNRPNHICQARCFWYGRYHIESGRISGLVVAGNLYWPAEVGFRGVVDTRPTFADPMFVNAARRDYRLKPGSPAINSGRNLGFAYKGSAPDIGANESEKK